MAKGIKRKLGMARNRVNEEIVRYTDRTNLFSRGLASEGFMGGYRQALSDIGLMLDGVMPNDPRTKDFWR